MAAGQGFEFKMNTPTATYKANTFFLDYYAVSLGKCIPIDTVEKLHIGESEVDNFAWKSLGPYTERSPLGVTVREYGSETHANYFGQIVDSGAACLAFPEFYPAFMEYTEKHNIATRVTRCDIAFDTVMPVMEWRDLLHKAINKGFENIRPGVEVISHGDASTIYIGSRKDTHIYIRIYNKSLQDSSYKLLNKNGDDLLIPSDKFIIRFEVELKRRADSAIDVNGKRKRYEYRCEGYVNDLYNNPEALLASLREIYAPVEKYFGIKCCNREGMTGNIRRELSGGSRRSRHHSKQPERPQSTSAYTRTNTERKRPVPIAVSGDRSERVREFLFQP